jgi:hypothetical protein
MPPGFFWTAKLRYPMRTETIYEGPAHGASFHLPEDGGVRFAFSDPRANGYVRSPDGSMVRVGPGTRLVLRRGRHALSLYDPSLTARVSISFLPE